MRVRVREVTRISTDQVTSRYYQPNEEIDVPEELGASLVAAGQAEEVKAKPEKLKTPKKEYA